MNCLRACRCIFGVHAFFKNGGAHVPSKRCILSFHYITKYFLMRQLSSVCMFIAVLLLIFGEECAIFACVLNFSLVALSVVQLFMD